MMTLLLLALLICIAAVIIDGVKDTEISSLAVLLTVIIACIYEYTDLFALVLLLPLRYFIYTAIHRNIARHLDKKHIVAHYIPVAMYLALGVASGYVAQRVIITLFDVWSARVVYVLILFLSLTLTVAPSLDSLTLPASLVIVDIGRLASVLYKLANIIGIVVSAVALTYLKTYMIVPAVLTLLIVLKQRSLGTLRKYAIPLTFYVGTLVLMTIRGF